MAFYYPIGIPKAWIEPNVEAPTAPINWDAEIPGYYYVDLNSPTASSKVTYGHPGEPRTTVPIDLPAGSYVEIHGGLYEYTSTIYVFSRGTAENPCWIVGKNAPRLKITFVITGTYLYIDGLNLEGNRGFSIRPYQDRQTDHIMVRNCNIVGTGVYGAGTTAISCGGIAEKPMVGIISYNNNISYMGDSEIAAENDNHAMQTGSHVTDVWYLYNHTHHNGGDGVQFSHGGINANHFYYGGNISHDEGENCVDIKQADDVVISSNLMYGIEESSSSSGENCVTHYGGSRQWFINNVIHSSVGGIVSTGCFDLHIIGNLIYDMVEVETEDHGEISTYQSGSAFRMYSTGNAYIANNTIHNVTRGIAVEALQSYDVVIEGNIITDLVPGKWTGNPAFNIMVKGSSTSVENSVIRNNLFYNPASFYVKNKIYTSFEEMQAELNKGEGCIIADPQYVDYPSDVRLKPTSPAIGMAGQPVSYQKFNDLYASEGVFINADLDGKLRDGVEVDAGAYQLVGEFVPATPNPVSGLFVNVIDSALNWTLNSVNEDFIRVVKNETLIATLPTGTTSYTVPGINSSEDIYRVITFNDTGESKEVVITSSIISATITQDNITRTLPLDKSHKLIREYSEVKSGMVIEGPFYVGTEYTIDSSKMTYTKADGETGTGYNYMVGDANNTLSGNLVGDGVVEVIASSNNFSKTSAVTHIHVNDSIVVINNDGGFYQAIVEINVADEQGFRVYTPKTNLDSGFGVSAIIQKS
jgi:hypothetical protein